MAQETVRPRFLCTASGQYRTRTYDPCDVNAVLYQLSQLPVWSLFYRLLVSCQVTAFMVRALAVAAIQCAVGVGEGVTIRTEQAQIFGTIV